MIKKGFLQLILIIFLLEKISCITSETIKIKFKTLKFLDENNKNLIKIYDYEKNDDYDLLKEKYFYYDLILNNIYSEIYIGLPPQTIIGFYSGKANDFAIIKDKCFINNSKYNRNLSSTFQNLSDFNIIYKNYDNYCFAKEYFEFESYNDNNNKIIFDNLKFFLMNDNKKYSCALIGLRLNTQDIFIETPKNFIFYLIDYFAKKPNVEKIIKSYYWTFKFENKQEINEGYISIGEPPHIYDSKNYKNKKFHEFNIQTKYSTINWEIHFNQIFLNKNDEIIYLKKYNQEGHQCLFYPELNIILSTIEYFNIINKEFFNKFFSKNICFIKKVLVSEINSTIIEGLSGEYTLIYCDKNKIILYDISNFYSEFPSINFYYNLLNFNFTFTLNASDLFYEDNLTKKIFFLIGMKNNDIDQWVFGKTFMKKYQFIFNSEMKTIGFYTILENNNKNEKNYEINYINILILITILIMIISFLCLIAYKYRKVLFKAQKTIALEMELLKN